jgi:hypothetical protein
LAVAVNCSVAPTAMLAVAGITAIEVSVFAAAVTVSAAVPLNPPAAAVIVEEPAATADAIPAALTVAVAVLELVHVADELMSPVDPSL